VGSGFFECADGGRGITNWKTELQKLANDTGLRLHVCHYPPGMSWNKNEHRMFSHITENCRGRPLETVETVVNLIGSTTTSTGLRIRACSTTSTTKRASSWMTTTYRV
jgi:hypothetical protein